MGLQDKNKPKKQLIDEVAGDLLARQEALLAAVPDIIMEVDNNKVYTWANQAGFEFFGEDVIGKEAAQYFEGEQDTYGVVKPLFEGNENVFYVESWQRRRDGQKRLLAWWCRVLKDDSGNVTGALSSARDITEIKKTEQELIEKERQLEIKANNLEETNIALKVLLEKRNKDKTEIEENILLNIKELVVPYLAKLKKSKLDDKQELYVDILESNLNDITSSFSRRLSSEYMNFTPAEIQIANLLRQDKTNKEISELLNCSPRTVAFHRENIRKKLGLKNKKINLKSYLLSFTR
jgi:PAS domain S-box-containing protein